jgi:hypothetical protein
VEWNGSLISKVGKAGQRETKETQRNNKSIKIALTAHVAEAEHRDVLSFDND